MGSITLYEVSNKNYFDLGGRKLKMQLIIATRVNREWKEDASPRMKDM